jgi:hypothetical protein
LQLAEVTSDARSNEDGGIADSEEERDISIAVSLEYYITPARQF